MKNCCACERSKAGRLYSSPIRLPRRSFSPRASLFWRRHRERIAQQIAIDMPFPRTNVTRESKEFESYVTEVSRALRGVRSA